MTDLGKKIYAAMHRGLARDWTQRDFEIFAAAIDYNNATEEDVHLANAMAELSPSVLNKAKNAFSRGQIDSKFWLVRELKNHLSLECKEILILGGWIGLLAHIMMREIESEALPRRVYSLDIDSSYVGVVDRINRKHLMDDWRVKGVVADMLNVDYLGQKFNSVRSDGGDTELFCNPDIIINTSTEHLESPRSWWTLIPENKNIVLQSNNLFEEDSHHSCVRSLQEMHELLPCTEIFYSGELSLQHYDRFMIIGRK